MKLVGWQVLRSGAIEIARSCSRPRRPQHGREGLFSARVRLNEGRSDRDEPLSPITCKSHSKARQKRRDADIARTVEWQRWAAIPRAGENSNILGPVSKRGALGC